jgi:hypothetical protein
LDADLGDEVHQCSSSGILCGYLNGLTGWRLPTQPKLSALYLAYPYNSAVLLGKGWHWVTLGRRQ